MLGLSLCVTKTTYIWGPWGPESGNSNGLRAQRDSILIGSCSVCHYIKNSNKTVLFA